MRKETLVTSKTGCHLYQDFQQFAVIKYFYHDAN